MYFTHTGEGVVYAYDYHPPSSSSSDAAITNPRVFYRHRGTGGVDGFRVDAEGFMWHAVYGEGRVLKLRPSSLPSGEAELVGEIRLPTPNITCVEFVGSELFITTAGAQAGDSGVTEDQAAKSGALYRVDVGVRGLGSHAFKM